MIIRFWNPSSLDRELGLERVCNRVIPVGKGFYRIQRGKLQKVLKTH